MRTLATIAFSFSAAVFAAVLLPFSGWQLPAAVLCAAGGAVFAFLKKRRRCVRALLVLLSMCAGFLFTVGYRAIFVVPVQQLSGEEEAFTAVVCEKPQASEAGASVTVRLSHMRGAKAVYYGEESLLELQPGNVLSGTAYWKAVEYDTLNAKGVYLLLYDRDDLTVSEGNPQSPRWWPQKAADAFGKKIGAIWDDEHIKSFLTAELTGDKSAMVETDYTALQETGLAHLFAVSGLHCAFLAALVQFCIPRTKRRLGCIVTIGVLLFYMCMTGLTPSVVRACVMQIFLLSAPLFWRASDSLTSLGAALLVILLCNPYAAAGVSLQLSFAATFGLATLSPRIFAWSRSLYRGKNRAVKKGVSFVCANLSATVGAMVFTTPLVAYYFNILSLCSPITGLLTISAAGWSFMSGFLATLAGFVWLPAGRISGIVPAVLVHYILRVAHGFARLPYHAVYFSTNALRCWLVYAYAVFAACFAAQKRPGRKYAAAVVLCAAMLAVTLWSNAQDYRAGTLGVTVLDVGQGESVLLYAGREAAMVDCGSSTRYTDAGDIAADQLATMGYQRLCALVVTHYHADHTNGLSTLLTRVPVDTIYLPEIDDEFGVKEELAALAEKYGTDIVWVSEKITVPLGTASLTLFPPLGEGDLNETCVAALATAGDFDVLITGDMPADTEKALAGQYDLPDTEVLLVSHHGSKYSSDSAFLEAITPEAAIISVGENSYGHPHQEALWRLSNAGAEIYRTDEAGHITVRSGEGEN